MRILCIIGPSGAGKSTVVSELATRGLVSVTASTTDRPRRTNESLLEHQFVSVTQFDQSLAAGMFLDHVQPFGLPYRYGLPAIIAEPGHVPLAMLRAPFVARLKQFYDDIVVYQVEAPRNFVEWQLADRGQELGSRLTDYEAEIQAGRAIADRIFVNERTIAALADDISQAIHEDFNNI